MTTDNLALFLALGATLAFATSSLVYAEYAKRVSVLWMNCFKASVAMLLVIVTLPLLTTWHWPRPISITGFILSGFIGLNIADLFILSAFVRLGVARTLILYGFQPLIVGIGAYYLFDQPFHMAKLVALVFLIACLFTFSFEKFRKEKRWEVLGLGIALMGITLDGLGILITRGSFAASPDVAPIEGHFWRCLGALIGFALMSFYRPIPIISGFKQWSPKVRGLILLASFGGTYFSLLLYLTAVRIGHLASIAGISITGPVFATLLESIYHRRKPSRYLLVAFAFFCMGFYVLLTAT